MNNGTPVASVTLHNNVGTSDKLYQCDVVRAGDLYLVNTLNGRRGGSMTLRTKTKQPVSLDAAMKIYDSVIREKRGDSYQVLGAGQLEAQAVSDDLGGPFHQPQLLNDIDRDVAMTLIDDDRWVMQEKKDGKRIAASISLAAVRISNKSARPCSIPGSIIQAIQSLHSDVLVGPVQYLEVDGELVDGQYHIFDIFAIDGLDLRTLPYETRASKYTRLIQRNKSLSTGDTVFDVLQPVETIYGAEAKRAAFDRIEAAKGEGVVFKLRDMVYSPGRPNSMGPALKFKFRESSTAICLGDSSDGRRSIRLGMIDGTGSMVNVGKVTVPPNQVVPRPGDLVEILYLYKFEDGCLFQPVLRVLSH